MPGIAVVVVEAELVGLLADTAHVMLMVGYIACWGDWPWGRHGAYSAR